jgi:uncharacterized damage-inducible protein DinB
VAGELKDPRRSEPEFGLAERPMLEQWLEFHRVTLQVKCEGLTDEQRKARPVTTSNLSLHGLVRHMSEVERQWFVHVLEDRPETGWYFSVEGQDDSELVPLDGAVWDDDLATWQRACEESRAIAARHGLDDTGGKEFPVPCTLRWILAHMVEEYARHNGHANLLRELADGAVGW